MEGEAYADALHFVACVAYAGGVDEAEGDAAEGFGGFDGVARGAADAADDGALFVEQGVEEGGLAGVGLSDDADGDAAFQGVAEAEGGGEACDFRVDFVGEVLELAAVGKFEVFVVGEVEFEFEQRGEVQEAFAQLSQLTAVSAAHLVDGHAVCGGVACGDEVGHGFGLAEVHFAVQEGSFGVFAGACQAASVGGEQAQHGLEDVGGAVAGDFDAVFAGVGVGGAIEGDDNFVDERAVVATYFAERGATGLCRIEGPAAACMKQGCDVSDGPGARNAHNAQGAARGGGEGADGVFAVCHVAKVAQGERKGKEKLAFPFLFRAAAYIGRSQSSARREKRKGKAGGGGWQVDMA